MLRRGVLTLVVLAALAGVGAAQPAMGPEFRVNTYTTYDQTASSVGADAHGNFVVTWTSDPRPVQRHLRPAVRPAGHTPGRRVPGQRGTAGLPERVEGRRPSGWPFRGGLVRRLHLDGDGLGIFARRFDAAVNPLGADFQVNSYTLGYQYSPALATTSSGGFVVVWAGYTPLGEDEPGAGVFGRLFDAAGIPVGGEFRVNAYTTGEQRQPSVAGLPGGGFVVVWSSDSYTGEWQDGDGAGVFGQRFNAAGAPAGPEFQVNVTTVYAQDRPQSAWTPSATSWWPGRADTAGSFFEIVARRFDAGGTALGGEITVNTYTTGRQVRPRWRWRPTGTSS